MMAAIALVLFGMYFAIAVGLNPMDQMANFGLTREMSSLPNRSRKSEVA